MTALEVFAVVETVHFLIIFFVMVKGLAEIKAMLNKRKDGDQK